MLFILRGNGASIARIVPYAALHYMAYEEYRRWIILGFPDVGRGPVLDLVAGSFAGGTAVIFTYPLDLVRTKLAYQASLSPLPRSLVHDSREMYSIIMSAYRTVQVVEPSKVAAARSDVVYKGIRDCFSKIHKEAGIRGLYRGVGRFSELYSYGLIDVFCGFL